MASATTTTTPDAQPIEDILHARRAFHLTNEEAVRWADEHAAAHIRDLTTEMRTELREMIRNSFVAGIPPRELAVQIQDGIGLAPAQAQAVSNYRKSLEKTDLAPEKIDKLVSEYRDNWIKFRALTIARTETIAAAVMGQQAIWDKASRAGLLQVDEWEQSWIVTPDDRLCPRCRPYHDIRAPLNGTFENGVTGPPLHPRCRCAIGLKIVGTPRNSRKLPEYKEPPPAKLRPDVPDEAVMK